MFTEEEKNDLTKKYQEKYRRSLDELTDFITELVLQQDKVGLVFLAEVLTDLLNRAWREVGEEKEVIIH
jgi:hypothetical protein